MNARIWALGVLLVAALGCGGDDDGGNAAMLGDGGGIATCVPGKTDLCACAGGQPGVQTCGLDGTFRPCECGSSDSSGSDASGNASTNDGGGDGNACTQGGPSLGRSCACDGGQNGVQSEEGDGAFGPCACPKSSDAGVSDASAAVICNAGGGGDFSRPGCPSPPGSVLCRAAYSDCSDGQSYAVACVTQQDGTVMCQCDVSGSAGIAYHANSCGELSNVGTSFLTSCGWNLCGNHVPLLPQCLN